MDKIKKLFADKLSKKELIKRVRVPECCIFCSNQLSQDLYNAALAKSGRYLVDDSSKIENLVIMEERDLISMECPQCKAVTVKQRYLYHPELVLYWTDPPCPKCNQKLLTAIEHTCPQCNSNAKKATEEMIAKVVKGG